jgi:5-formyltetrahydrofolate cyclo-ligase
METDKINLRLKLKSLRAELSLDDKKLMSAAICERLTSLTELNKIKSIHIYEPFLNLNEPDIGELINSLKEKKYIIQTSRKFGGSWQVVELAKDKAVPSKLKVEVILVPMLGFDDKLNRIGYGGGYYDQLLESWTDVFKIGICYDICRVDKLPVEPHDIPMDLIITDKQIYS